MVWNKNLKLPDILQPPRVEENCSLLCVKLHFPFGFPFQAFTIMDQNRDGFIDKSDLRDTFCALGETLTLLSKSMSQLYL